MTMPIAIEPLLKHGLFQDTDTAITEMVRVYTANHVQQYQATINELQAKYGMDYDTFLAYLQARAEELMDAPSPELNEAMMLEEEDALDWQIARDMLRNWLTIQVEAQV
jgi:hypothetical protein